MVRVTLIIDEIIAPKINTPQIETVLTRHQKDTGNPEQQIALFIICTSSKRWQEGKWKNKEWINYSVRFPRETVDNLSKEEVSELIVKMAKQVFQWEKAAAA